MPEVTVVLILVYALSASTTKAFYWDGCDNVKPIWNKLNGKRDIMKGPNL